MLIVYPYPLKRELETSMCDGDSPPRKSEGVVRELITHYSFYPILTNLNVVMIFRQCTSS